MTAPGLIVLESDAPFAPTVARLDAALSERRIEPSARIDHGLAARGADVSLEPMLLLVFGNAAAGSPLMRAVPTIGIDLPLKLLVWESYGRVRVGYNDPIWIAQRHGLASYLPILQTMRDLLASLAGAAATRKKKC